MDRLPPELQHLIVWQHLTVWHAPSTVTEVCRTWRAMAWAARLDARSHADACSRAVRALIRLGPAAIQQHCSHLLLLLEHSSVLVRHTVIIALSALGSGFVAEHIGAFVALMRDQDEDVSFGALCALTKLPHEQLEPYARQFRACLKHPSAAARSGALQALGSIGKEAVARLSKPICARLRDPDAQVRSSAAVVLAVIPAAEVPASVTSALRQVLDRGDEDPRVRSSVLETLAKHEQSAQVMHVNVLPGLGRCNDGLGGLSLGDGGHDGNG